MTKQDILDRINELILDEKGIEVGPNNLLSDAELDSIGLMMMIATLDSEFPFLSDDEKNTKLSKSNIQNITIRELVRRCKFAITEQLQEQKEEKDT